MKSLPLNQLGPHESIPGILDFGILLPWISAANGNRLFVKIIHEHDQFIQAIQPLAFELQHGVNADYGDMWSGKVDFNTIRDLQPGLHFGSPGRYVYRFELHNPNLVKLTRSLINLRRNCVELRRGSHYFHNNYEHYLSRGILLFQRENAEGMSLIAVNFTDIEQTVPFVFTRTGDYIEQLHGLDNFDVEEGQERGLTIPSNYGRIWRNA